MSVGSVGGVGPKQDCLIQLSTVIRLDEIDFFKVIALSFEFNSCSSEHSF